MDLDSKSNLLSGAQNDRCQSEAPVKKSQSCYGNEGEIAKVCHG